MMQLAPLFPVVYRILQPTFPNCLWAGDPNSKAIALTFDDGPHPTYTPQLLEVLAHYHVPASFFLLGACVERERAIARAISTAGHSLGLHGYDHRSFPFLTTTELQQSLQATQNAISKACGLHPTNFRDVRPPNGLFTPQILHALHQWQYRSVMWSVVPEDWVHPGVSLVADRILQQVTNGSVIVLHDGVYGGQDVAATTALIIPQLLQQGYNFVTVDTLWQQREVKF